MKKAISLQFSVFSLIALLVAATANAQVTVVKGFQKRLISINGITGSSKLTEILRNDIRLSGSLGLAKNDTTAEFIQQGTLKPDGSVECLVTHLVTKKSVLSKLYTATPDTRRLAHTISDDIVLAITGQPGIAQTRIAFILKRGKDCELAVMDYDGANPRQLTRDRLCGHPRWSPDGAKIVYTSYWQMYPDILEVNLLTGARRTITRFPGLNSGAEYSPDGRRLAMTLSKDGNPALYTISVDGTGLQRLTHAHGAQSSPTWSPDGQRIAYVSDERGTPQIYLIHRTGGEPEKLTASPSYNTEPNWSRPPANSEVKQMIAVTSRVGGRFQIGVCDSATGDVRPVAADDTDNEDPSWSPNGRLLVFTKNRSWHSRLYLLDVLTGEQLELPSFEGGACQPAWGPQPGRAQ